MTHSGTDKIKILLEKGVTMPSPASVDIGVEVDPANISGDGVSLYPGCRIYGSKTLILAGTRIGYESPATIDNCYVGPRVSLNGGFFSGAVFLEGASCGSGAHVRAGTIFEEQARCAHTVGLKQTILFPFVTLGSLINFCDICMTGGTSSQDHSEVGSAYIHFNYTPNQDKATASLLGDVPRGVMLDQPPIFLGGQGGLVGPCALAFGTTLSAGSICRKDEKKSGRLIIEGASRSGRVPFSPGVYRGIKRIVHHNMNYIGNLLALRQWYRHVRALFISIDRYPEELARGLSDTLEAAVNERIKQFESFCLKMPASIERLSAGSTAERPGTQVQQQQELFDQGKDVKATLQEGVAFTGDIGARDRFLESVNAAIQNGGNDYIFVIKGLSESERADGTEWLQSIVDQAVAAALSHLPFLE